MSFAVWMVIWILLIIVISIFCYFAYIYYINYQKELRKHIIEVVQEINKANFYTYSFDKQQEHNIVNMEDNINSLMNNYDSLKNDIGKVKRDYLSRDAVTKKIDTDDIHVKHLYIGDTAFVKKGNADGSNWLHMYNGGRFTGGMAMKDISAENGSFAKTKTSRLTVNGDTIVNGKVLVSGQGICLGRVCLRENNGLLQTCDKSYLSCKNVV